MAGAPRLGGGRHIARPRTGERSAPGREVRSTKGGTGMYCPTCHHEDSRVIDSRSVDEGQAIRRRRECPECGHRFTTAGTRSSAVSAVPVRGDRWTRTHFAVSHSRWKTRSGPRALPRYPLTRSGLPSWGRSRTSTRSPTSDSHRSTSSSARRTISNGRSSRFASGDPSGDSAVTRHPRLSAWAWPQAQP